MSARKIYYWFTALLSFGMGCHSTIYGPFLRSIGLSLGEIALVNVVYWVVIILAELPTGMLADGRSRAWSLKMGVAIQGIGAVIYLFSVGFWSAVTAEAILGIGSAFLSGAQQAWIADGLAREGKREDLRHVYATESMIRTLSFILAGFCGSAIAVFSYRLTWLPLSIAACIVLIFCHRQMNGQGEPMERLTEFQAFRASWSLLFSSPSLKWVTSTMIVLGLIVSYNHYWSIYFEPKVGTIGLSWIWVLIVIGYLSSGWIVRRLSIGLGHEGALIALSLFLAGFGIFAISLSSSLLISCLFVVIHEFGRGMSQPLTDSFVQHRIESSYRATFSSLQSLIGRIGFAVVPLIVWMLVEGQPNTVETIELIWLVCGSLLMAGSLILFLIRPR